MARLNLFSISVYDGVQAGQNQNRPSTAIPNDNFILGSTAVSWANFMVGAAFGFDYLAHYRNFLNFFIPVYTEQLLATFPNALGADAAPLTAYIDAEIRNGNWFKLDAIIFLNLTDPVNALWDAKRGVAAASNTGVHTAGVGMAYDGTQFTDSGFNPSTNGVNATLTNNQTQLFVLNHGTLFSNTFLFGNRAAAYGFTLWHASSSQLNINNGSDASVTVGGLTLTPNILYANTRNGNTVSLLRDGASIGSSQIATPLAQSANIFIGARNIAGSPSLFSNISASIFLVGAEVGWNHAEGFTNLQTLNAALAP